jgi:hypothetical protein
MPFKVTFGSPIVGVLVIFNESDEAAIALSTPRKIKEREAKRAINLFTRLFPI